MLHLIGEFRDLPKAKESKFQEIEQDEGNLVESRRAFDPRKQLRSAVAHNRSEIFGSSFNRLIEKPGLENSNQKSNQDHYPKS